MISCDLRGGLGNQLFQIVATIAYCIKNKLPFIFPYSEMLNEHQTYWDTLFNKIISKWEKEFPVPVATPATPAIPTLS